MKNTGVVCVCEFIVNAADAGTETLASLSPSPRHAAGVSCVCSNRVCINPGVCINVIGRLLTVRSMAAYYANEW